MVLLSSDGFHSTEHKIKVLIKSNKMIYNDLAPYNPSHFLYYFPLHLFLSRHPGSLLVLKHANQTSSQVVWVPKTSPRYGRRTHRTRTEYTVIFTTVIYITVKGREAKSAKGNVSWGEQVQASKPNPASSPVQGTFLCVGRWTYEFGVWIWQMFAGFLTVFCCAYSGSRV